MATSQAGPEPVTWQHSTGPAGLHQRVAINEAAAVAATEALEGAANIIPVTEGTLFTDLKRDVLAIIASYCGKDISVLACTCQAARHVFHDVVHSAPLLAQLLLLDDAKPQHGGAPGSTPIDVICAHGVERVVANAVAVRVLLKAGADVHAADDNALRRAACCGFDGSVSLLLKHGAWVHALDDAALVGAACNGHTLVVHMLLDGGAHVNARSDAPLIAASANGHAETAAVLLAHGANVHAVSTAAVYEAAMAGHEHILGLLAAAGANVNDSDGLSLHSAAFYGNDRAVALLLAAGADVHADGDKALSAAAGHGHEAVVRLLLGAGATLTLDITRLVVDCDNAGVLNAVLDHSSAFVEVLSLALLSAIERGCALSKVQLMLDRDYLTQEDKDSLLVYAAELGRIDAARALLNAGADVNNVMVQQLSCGPLFAAFAKRNMDMVEFLLEQGADLDSELGQKAVEYMLQTRLSWLVEKLLKECRSYHQRRAGRTAWRSWMATLALATSSDVAGS